MIISTGSLRTAIAIAIALGAFDVQASDGAAVPGAVTAATVIAVGVESEHWTFPLPKDEAVPFHGVVSFDQAGTGAATMLYPAPNAIAMLAAVATHAMIEGSVRDSQKKKLQESADKILQPYQDVLSSFTEQQLFDGAIAHSHLGGKGAVVAALQVDGDDHAVDLAPAFGMTQDQSAIVLDVAVVVRGRHVAAGDDKAKSLYANNFRLVSSPRDQSDPVAYWTANGGDNLKSECARLLGESMDLAVMQIGKQSNPDAGQALAYKTFHYQEGKTDKIERAQLISGDDERTVIRNLRGWIISIPAQRVAFASVAPMKSGASQGSAGGTAAVTTNAASGVAAPTTP